MTNRYEQSRRDYIRDELGKIDAEHGQIKLKLLNETGESKWLNITPDQKAAIEKILLPGTERRTGA